MRILLVNKFYRASGGAERYVQLWRRLLEERGHTVIPFAMQDPRNWPTPYERFFARPISFNEGAPLRRRLAAAPRSVFSLDARRRIAALLRAVRPDVAHVHSYCYQLTPSILGPLRRAGVPVIQTAHEYKHACANQHLYDPRTGRICEACRGGRWYAPAVRRCIKGSLPASIAGCIEHAADRLIGMSRRGIGRVVAPSAFLRRKLIAFGCPGRWIVCVPNFVFPEDFSPRRRAEPYFLFLGRLVRHKGVATLLEAVRQAPAVRLVVAGDGPERPAAQNLASACGGRVEWKGFLDGAPLRSLLERCLAVVVPSQWYENCPYAVLEAMASGRAVVASRIGGIPELVEDGATGLLFEPGDCAGLVERLRRLWDDRSLAAQLGRAGRRRVEALYAPDAHYRRMMGVIRGVM